MATDFMRDHAHSHRTRKEMQRKIDVDLKSWHDIQIADITRGDIKELLREKARSGPIAANRLLALISKIFSWALEAPAVPIEAVPGGLAAGFSALCPDRNRSSLLTTKPFALAECWRRYAIVDAILL